MTRWRKVSTVAAFEFLGTVRRPGYLIATLGMPLFMAAYGGVLVVSGYISGGQDRAPAVHGIVDHAGILQLAGETPASPATQAAEDLRRSLAGTAQGAALQRVLDSTTVRFRPFDTEEEARDALAGRTIRGYFVLPGSYLADGAVTAYGPDTFTGSGGDARDALRQVLRQRLMAERLEPVVSARILDPIARTERFAVTRGGEVREGGSGASAVRLALPLTFMLLFLLSVLMTSGYLMQGTAFEKENKVVEVLLASADPDEILGGKLLGLGGAGLLQMTLWLAMMLVTGIGVIPLLVSVPVDVPWLALALALPFFTVAFLFFGSLILGTGSLGGSMREAQQLSMVWSLLAALPLMMMAVLMRDPNGTVSRVLTWMPFTSGSVIVLRASSDPGSVAWWEIGGAFLVLVLSTWIALRVGARLFRVGLLSAGARPGLREILRQARLGA